MFCNLKAFRCCCIGQKVLPFPWFRNHFEKSFDMLIMLNKCISLIDSIALSTQINNCISDIHPYRNHLLKATRATPTRPSCLFIAKKAFSDLNECLPALMVRMQYRLEQMFALHNFPPPSFIL